MKARLIAEFFLFFSVLAASAGAKASECTVKKIAGMPVSGHDGVAGAFIGTIDSRIIVAGGSDFTGPKPWEGGTKAYFDDIYIIEYNDNGYQCRLSGKKLPVALSSGCSASSGKALYCFGGYNSHRRSDAVYSISFIDNERVQVDSICPMPEGFIPAAAEFIKGEIFLHGSADGKNMFYRFSPVSRQWKELASCPASLIYEGATLTYQHNGREEALYLIGGRGDTEEGIHISSSVWEYLPAHNIWNKKHVITLDGKESGLMYASAVRFGSAHILVFGGDDGQEFLKRERLGQEIETCNDPLQQDSLRQELVRAFTSHQGFSDKIFAYHTITDTWTELDTSGFPFPVVTGAALLNGKIIIPSGEISPGVRTSDI